MSPVSLLLGRTFSPHVPGGLYRIAAAICFVLALLGAALMVSQPEIARWAGALLLVAIGGGAGFVLYAAWPRTHEGVEEARRVASAAAASNIAWAVTGRDGAVLECNVAYRLLAGAGDGDPPAPPQLAFPGDAPAAALYRLARAAADGRAREEDFETDTGQRLSASVRPLRRGEAAWWFTPCLPAAAPPRETQIDKRAPSALIRFTDFFRYAPVGVAITGSDGQVAEANGAFAQFFALGAFATGARFADLIAPTARTAALNLIAHAAAGQVSHEPVEVHSATEASRSAQLYAGPFAASVEGKPRAILYLVDTSEQKALETQFAQSQKMQAIGQLAGGVAHDFNNLLQAIIGNTDLLLMRHSAGDPSFAEINEVRQNSVRAAGLVRQLLAFSRQQTLQPKVLGLSDTLTELSMLLRRLLGEKVNLKFAIAPDLWPVRADEGQIGNAIMNLVVNARDAMPPEGGTVTISTSNFTLPIPRSIGTATMPAGDYVCVDVADTGHGIPKDNLAKIFDPFFTTKPVGQGTGLGLSTVYGIVKQTGGYVTVDSTVGKGTVFHIYLPRYDQRDEALPPVPAPAEAAPEESDRAQSRDITGQETILLVEDEEAVRSFAARALRMRGYTVIEANGGEAALDLVRKHPSAIDLIVTDVVMPNMDGPTMVRAAKRLRPETRVVFMSGYAEDAFRRNDEKAEDLHFLPKPFGLKQLVAKVKEVLSDAAPATPPKTPAKTDA